jgi:putative beta-lysine N-acetyltransferase
MRDLFETIGRSSIHHGPFSDRLYLQGLHPQDFPGIIPRMDRMARERGYGKVLARVPEDIGECFVASGYVCEAAVPGFFDRRRGGVFVSKYFSPDRRKERDPAQLSSSMAELENVSPGTAGPGRRAADAVEPCDTEDTPEMSRVFRSVFATYPYPVDDPDYLKDAMCRHTSFFCVRDAGKIVAISSAEMDLRHGNAEMTDFAVLPRWRNRQLATRLLCGMEAHMRRRGIRVVYTIARALLPAVNVLFKKMGYSFGGILTNNTQIGGRIETMTVWYKPLGDENRLQNPSIPALPRKAKNLQDGR